MLWWFLSNKNSVKFLCVCDQTKWYAGYSARSFSDLDPSNDIQQDSFIVQSFNKVSHLPKLSKLMIDID